MESYSPITSEVRQPVGLPDPEQSRLMGSSYGMGLSGPESERVAREVIEGHRRGKANKRNRNLTAEKYLLHIDGEGDSQWADIIGGSRVAVPPNISGGLRLQDNLLEVMVRHVVAYLTSQRYHVLALAKSDLDSRNRARIDTILANDFIRRQRLNQVISGSLWFAAAYGNCPVHAVWRDDLTADAYEPLYDSSTEEQGGGYGAQAESGQPGQPPMPGQPQELRRGFVDLYQGDPWATVYNGGAKRHSVQWFSYDRVMPITLIHQNFAHVEGIEEVKGQKNLPSASRFQRISQRWESLHGGGWHGSATSEGSGGDELVSIVCRELAPGVLREWPEGRLEIAVVSGSSDTDEEGVSGKRGKPVLLHQGPLPGKRFSAVRFYLSSRGDDVEGRPYVSDIDDDQVYLNQLRTLEAEWVKRFARPQFLVGPGGVPDDTLTTEDDAVIEHGGDTVPQFAYPPSMPSPYRAIIQDVRESMFRKSGWQAASRGEGNSGDAAAKVIALQRADDSIFAPLAQGIRDSVSELCGVAHALRRKHMIVPDAVTTIAGEDLSHIAEPYVTREQMSEDPPYFEVVSGFGATPEAQAQQLIQLVQMKTAANEPLLSRDEFWRLWPDPTIKPPELSAKHLREARALRRNGAIKRIADQLEQKFQDMAPRFAPQAIQMVMQEFPQLPTDDPRLHVETLDQIVQDDDSSPIAKQIAMQVQAVYLQQIQAQQAAQMQMQGGQPQRPAQRPQQQQPGQPQRPPGQPPQPGQRSPKVTRNANNPSAAVTRDVQSLTRQAEAM